MYVNICITYLKTYMNTYLGTYIPGCMYIHVYTYTHTYTHTVAISAIESFHCVPLSLLQNVHNKKSFIVLMLFDTNGHRLPSNVAFVTKVWLRTRLPSSRGTRTY